MSTSSADLSIIPLILNASVFVQIVMGTLLIASIASWAQIFAKYFAIKKANQQSEEFERTFWSGNTSLSKLYEQIGQKKRQVNPEISSLEKLFEAGMSEFLKSKEKQISDPSASVDLSRRAMKATFQREMDGLESGTPLLATIGSVSPYIGLLGTVWGIMNSFRGLANVQQATLSAVAPGIAEALIATAIGLFAAIPAVIAYNRFTDSLDRIAGRLENFVDEFSNILQRHS